jgi:hypothetical protein
MIREARVEVLKKFKGLLKRRTFAIPKLKEGEVFVSRVPSDIFLLD